MLGTCVARFARSDHELVSYPAVHRRGGLFRAMCVWWLVQWETVGSPMTAIRYGPD